MKSVKGGVNAHTCQLKGRLNTVTQKFVGYKAWPVLVLDKLLQKTCFKFGMIHLLHDSRYMMTGTLLVDDQGR